MEGREGNAGCGHEHAGAVEVWAEEPEFAVEAAVELHAFEAFGCVVEAGGCGHEGEGAVGFKVRGRPAGLGGPLAGYHVVCTYALGGCFCAVWGWDNAGGGGVGGDELGGIEFREWV